MCKDCFVSSSPFDGDAVFECDVPFVVPPFVVSSVCANECDEPFVFNDAIDPFPFVKLLLLISFVKFGKVGIQLGVVSRNLRGRITCCLHQKKI